MNRTEEPKELTAAIQTIAANSMLTEDELRSVIEDANRGYHVAISKITKACKKQMKCKHNFSVPDTYGRITCNKCGFITPQQGTQP